MATRISAITTCLLLCASIILGQEKLGINTTAPFRSLEVYGSSGQFIRVQSSSNIGGSAGIEFIRGLNGVSATDWKIVNDGGALRFQYSEDNFSSNGLEAMRISPTGYTGIGTNIPSSSMHIDGGSQLAFGGTGYLKIGTGSSLNLAFDNTQFVALDNGLPADLTFQNEGGNTYFCNNGGNTYMGSGNGIVGAGTNAASAKLMLHDEGFQLYLQNSSGGVNGWHIGASNGSWVSGDNQLLFSPTGSSADAVLRLKNVTENNGTEAPVMLYNTYNYTLLLDGNEIDTRGTPLYINHNSDEETYINPSGGLVGIGTASPATMLHISSQLNESTLALERGGNRWTLNPASYGTQNLLFYSPENANVPYSQIHGQTGQWMALSDKTLKENISLLPSVMPNLKRLKTYTYQFKSDPSHKRFTGVMAQETALLFPEMVSIADGQYGVAYAQLAAIGVKAVQEQQQMIDSLKEKIAVLSAALLSRDIKNNH